MNMCKVEETKYKSENTDEEDDAKEWETRYYREQIRRLISFGLMRNDTAIKPMRRTHKTTNYLNFNLLARLSLNDKLIKGIREVIESQVKEQGLHQGINDPLGQYIRYGDIMVISDYIIRYIDFIDARREGREKNQHGLKNFSKRNIIDQMSRLKDLLKTARNMFPTKGNMDTMANIIKEVLDLDYQIESKSSKGDERAGAQILTQIMERLYGKQTRENDKIVSDKTYRNKTDKYRILNVLHKIDLHACKAIERLYADSARSVHNGSYEEKPPKYGNFYMKVRLIYPKNRRTEKCNEQKVKN